MINLIRSRFVPVAIDQHIHRRLKDEEGKIFAKVLRQAGRGLGGRSQGVYLFSPAGKLLAFRNTASASTVKRLLTSALAKFDPAIDVGTVAKPPQLSHYFCEPPKGGLVLNVTTKVLGGYDQPKDERTKRYLQSLGRDHLWLRKDEAVALTKGMLPESIKIRIARSHLIDNTRGEPPMWRTNEIKKLLLTLKDGRITGSVHMETKSGDSGYKANLFGLIEVKREKVVRFDLVAKGDYWGHGTYTRFAAPKGKFPVAVAFTLVTDMGAADRVLPGGARGNIRNYLR